MKHLFFIMLILPLIHVKVVGQELKSKKVMILSYYEEYNVLSSDKKIKHGDYKKYKKDRSQLLSGKFDNNVKVGNWEYYEHDKLIQRYNYSEQKMTFQIKPENNFSVKRNGQVQLSSIDTAPDYLGSKIGLTDELNKVLEYPQHARRMGVEGPVTVGIWVNEDNSLGDIVLIKGLMRECDQNLIHALQKIPTNWFAGTAEDKAVSALLILTIDYKLDNIFEGAAVTVR